MNLYEQLEVSSSADAETIRKAIARQTTIWSRRVATSSTLEARHEAEAKMEVLAIARQTLLDGSRRRAYDAAWATQPGLPGPGPLASPEPEAPSPQREAEQKDCPFCGEVIKVKAVKCRHCGEFFTKGASSRRPAVSSNPVVGTGWALPLLAMAGIGALLIGVLLTRPGVDPLVAARIEPVSAETPAAAEVAPSVEPVAYAPSDSEVGSAEPELAAEAAIPEGPSGPELAVEAWRVGWESMDVTGMERLATVDFRGGDARRGAAFFENKRREFGITEHHTVSFDRIAVTMSGPDEAEATFSLHYASTYRDAARQKYKQTGYSNTVPTKLRLRREAGGWRIVSEQFHVR